MIDNNNKKEKKTDYINIISKSGVSDARTPWDASVSRRASEGL